MELVHADDFKEPRMYEIVIQYSEPQVCKEMFANARTRAAVIIELQQQQQKPGWAATESQPLVFTAGLYPVLRPAKNH